MKKNKFFQHNTAIVSDKARIGKDTKIWHFSHIREDAVIGENVSIGQNVYIDSGVQIGDNCKIQNNVSIYKGVVIEDKVFIGPSVTFTNDLYPEVEGWNDERIVNTLIREGASLGANSTIICGVSIGVNSLIGAGSVVTKNIDNNTVAYGNPAITVRDDYKK